MTARLPADLGTGCGESRSATTAVASHRLVQMRTRVMNQLHVVALNEGLRRKKALWRPAGRAELEGLSLAPWASRRRQDLLDLLDRLSRRSRN